MNRKEHLKGKAPQSPKQSASGGQAPPGNGEPGTLNIILHGSFVFRLLKGERKLEVLIPKVEDHVFRVGNWLAETELKGASHKGADAPEYVLEGLDAGDATFPREYNLILKCELELKKRFKRQLHALLRLPQPKAILTPRRAPVHADVFVSSAADGSSSAELERILLYPYGGFVPTLQVFTYSFTNDAALKLTGGPDGRGHAWEPAFARETVNLHIFSAEDSEHGLTHVTRAFDLCIRLFNGVRLSLPRTSLRGEPNPEVPRGISLEEYEDLAPRMRRMSQLGWRQKEGRDLNQLWAVDSEALDEDSNCESGPCQECG